MRWRAVNDLDSNRALRVVCSGVRAFNWGVEAQQRRQRVDVEVSRAVALECQRLQVPVRRRHSASEQRGPPLAARHATAHSRYPSDALHDDVVETKVSKGQMPQAVPLGLPSEV